jgi:hypothetical protein
MSGSVTLSIEIELGWGMHDKQQYEHLSKDGSVERATLKKLIHLCDELNIAISFDIVGHLLLDSCHGSHDGPYPVGWWAEDPSSNADDDPLFYFPEAIGWLSDSAVDHEICTHTFSHILLEEMEEDVLAAELETVKKIVRV